MSDNGRAPTPIDLYTHCSELVDDSPYAPARADAQELGAGPLDPLAADTVCQIARLVGARGAVCLTPALGVAALAILGAGIDGAVVTCIDDDPHHVDAARVALREAGYDASCARYITARPLDVLTKLADGGYDLLLAEVGAGSVSDVVRHAARLLRPGGVLLLVGIRSPLPADAEAPAGSHLSVLPVGTGLTLLTV